MFQIVVLFGVCLLGWFVLDRIVIEPSHMVRSATERSQSQRRRSRANDIRIYQMYDSASIEPAKGQKALYDAFGKRFFDYE
jgi:hypothetical protein